MQDFLSECNNLKVREEDFALQHCNRCFQRECTRSLRGKSAFEARTSTWEERLFTQVPRMPESDSRIHLIQAKRFLSIDRGPIPSIGAEWLDPRDIVERATPAVEDPVFPVEVRGEWLSPPEAPPEPSPRPAATSRPVPVSEPFVPTPMTVPEAPRPILRAPQLLNTAGTSSGLMVGGKTAPAPVDAWAAPKANVTGNLRVVAPGAKIKIKGDGV